MYTTRLHLIVPELKLETLLSFANESGFYSTGSYQAPGAAFIYIELSIVHLTRSEEALRIDSDFMRELASSFPTVYYKLERT